MSDVETLREWKRLLSPVRVTVETRGIRFAFEADTCNLEIDTDAIEVGPGEYVPGKTTSRLTAVGGKPVRETV